MRFFPLCFSAFLQACLRRAYICTCTVTYALHTNAWSCLTFTTCLFPPLPSRSEQICLARSDLLHMHLALAGMRFNHDYHSHKRCFQKWLTGPDLSQGLIQAAHLTQAGRRKEKWINAQTLCTYHITDTAVISMADMAEQRTDLSALERSSQQPLAMHMSCPAAPSSLQLRGKASSAGPLQPLSLLPCQSHKLPPACKSPAAHELGS